MTWQPIETAPKGDPNKDFLDRDGPYVLLGNDTNVWIGHFAYTLKSKRGRWVSNGRNSWWEPTHWMPVPEPPK